MKIVITGAAGFVSRYFMELLRIEEPGAEVLALDRRMEKFDVHAFPGLLVSAASIDLSDKALLHEVLAKFQADFILHLASASSVAKSWEQPAEIFGNNTGILLNLLEYLRTKQPHCRMLITGSSEQYGKIDTSQLPLTEETVLSPLSPYAVAKSSEEMLAKLYVKGYGLDIIMTRSFNHIGPGQRPDFVIPSFARQLVKIAADHTIPTVLSTGDLSVVRDFSDVRDVARAYLLLLQKGRKGEVYNVCSGKGIVLQDILSLMSAILHIQVSTITDPALIRPVENKQLTGSFFKINKDTGWQPEITLEQSLADILNYWKSLD